MNLIFGEAKTLDADHFRCIDESAASRIENLRW
jgi:hypothetical protein